MEEKIIEEIEIEAKKYFEDAMPTHDWSHIERCKKLSERIGKTENVDMSVIKLAVLLHDTGRRLEDETSGKIPHEKEGERIARKILEEYNLENSIIEKVCYCIRMHRFRGNNSMPETIEARVLYDTDKLDAIGAIGIARSYSFSGENHQKLYSEYGRDGNIDSIGSGYESEHNPVKEFLGKLIKVKDKMLTKEGKKIAEERHKFMIEFFDRLNKEIEGEL